MTSEAIQRIEGSAPAPVECWLRFEGFDFSCASETLYREGERVPLRPKAARLLAVLLERPGEVVARETLARAIWPHTHVEIDGGLNSLILGMRRTMADWGECRNLIETVPKKGYRFTGQVSRITAPAVRNGRRRLLRQWAAGRIAAALILAAALPVLVLDSGGGRQLLADRAAESAGDDAGLEAGLSGVALKHFLQGVAAHKSRDFTVAVTSFRAALGEAPDNARLRYWLARSLINAGGYRGPDMDEAVTLLKSALARAPDLADEAGLLQGYIALYRDLDVARADEAASRLLRRNPANADARFLAIEAALARGDRARVIDQADRMITIDPTSYSSVAAPGWMFFVAGATGRAIEYCRTLVEVEATNRSARFCLLFSYLEHGDEDAARAEGLTYMRLAGAPGTLINRVAADGTGWQPRFWSWFRDMISTRQAPGTIYMRGLVNYRLGEVDKSIADFERIVEMRPDPFLMWLPLDPRLAGLRDRPEAAHLFRPFKAAR